MEGIDICTGIKKPNGKPLVITSAEVSRTVAVFEVNIPSITASDNIICSGSSVTLTASGSGPYLWSTGATTASITVSPTSTTTYTVRVCNLSDSKTIVVIPPTPCNIIAIPNGFVYTGGEPTNLYLGYGPQSVTLFAQATWLGAPYTYSWTGGTLSSYNSAFTVFTATAPGNYTFTVQVTNRFGCVSTCSVTICVADIRVPGTNNKVYVCHDNGSASQTLELNVNAVPAHLFFHRDDRLGKCDDAPCTSPAARSAITAKEKEPGINGFAAKVVSESCRSILHLAGAE